MENNMNLMIMDKSMSAEQLIKMIKPLDDSVNDTLVSVTHVSDLDGLFSSICTVAHFNENRDNTTNVIVIPLHNNDDMYLRTCLGILHEFEIKVSEIYVTDIGLSKVGHEAIHDMKADYKMYIDHHESAIDMLKEMDYVYNQVVIDVEKCAAMLCYENLDVNSNLKKYVEVTNDRDLWLKEIEVSDSFASLFKLMGFKDMYTDFINGKHYLSGMFPATYVLSPEYALVIEFHNKVVMNEAVRFVQGMMYTEIEGISVGYNLYNGLNASDMSDIVFESSPEISIIAYIFTDGVSLRVRKDCDFNASEFSKERGGGGHIKASGYPLVMNTLLIQNFLRDFLQDDRELSIPTMELGRI